MIEDATLHSALGEFIHYSRSKGREFGEFRQVRNLADSFYRLFVEKCEMVTETEQTPWNLETVLSNMMLTEQSVRCILASQPVSPAGMSFELRFAIAMRSMGWPAQVFLDFLQCDDQVKLINQTDEFGRTALHWAAAHFGYWASTKFLRDYIPFGGHWPRDSYSDLVVKLIAMGADVHALSHDQQTPTMSFLRSVESNYELCDCTLAVEQWGLGIASSRSLAHYVQAENRLLHTSAYMHCRYDELQSSCTAQLLLLGNNTLAIQLINRAFITVWNYRPPPGAYDISHSLPRTIIWQPVETEKPPDVGLWQTGGEVEIHSEPQLVQRHAFRSMSWYNLTDLEINWHRLFSSTQDDSGKVAEIWHRCSKENSLIETRRTRASSAPPPKIYEGDNSRDDKDDILEVSTSHGRNHKCPLSAKWEAESYPLRSGGFHHRCKQRRCQSYRWLRRGSQRKRHWELDLRQDVGNFELVLGYADRFHPELRPVLEAEYEKNKRLVELESYEEASNDEI